MTSECRYSYRIKTAAYEVIGEGDVESVLLVSGPGAYLVRLHQRNQRQSNRGRILAQQWCAQCHGVHPNELSTDANAPSFSAIAREPSATEYALRVFLRTPHPTMPNFVLKPDNIDDLVSYIVLLQPD
jgi:mono/diheme cytochrome c family protein